MSFRPERVRGAPPAVSGAPTGQVDYRLARNAVLRELSRGRLARSDVCDAHPELLRAARGIGQDTDTRCPVCDEASLAHVSYAFGSHLPPGGVAFTGGVELARLARRAGEVTCYVVEVCPECAWNHLARTYTATASRRRSRAT